MSKKYRMTFRVYRPNWARGGAETSLVNKEDRTKCCLGFVGQQCGLTLSDMEGGEFYVGDVGDLSEFGIESHVKVPHVIRKTIQPRAIAINDDDRISDIEREKELRALFRRHGYDIVFTGPRKNRREETLREET